MASILDSTHYGKGYGYLEDPLDILKSGYYVSLGLVIVDLFFISLVKFLDQYLFPFSFDFPNMVGILGIWERFVHKLCLKFAKGR